MTSCDTNVLFVALEASRPGHATAREFLEERKDDSNFALCELVLMELYVLLRNPAVARCPLGGAEAASTGARLASFSSTSVPPSEGSSSDSSAALGFSESAVAASACGISGSAPGGGAEGDGEDDDGVGGDIGWLLKLEMSGFEFVTARDDDRRLPSV